MRTSGTFWHHVAHRKSRGPRSVAQWPGKLVWTLISDAYRATDGSFCGLGGTAGVRGKHTLMVRKSRLKAAEQSPTRVSGKRTSNPL